MNRESMHKFHHVTPAATHTTPSPVATRAALQVDHHALAHALAEHHDAVDDAAIEAAAADMPEHEAVVHRTVRKTKRRRHK